jgi:DNA-directed RNA polymerase II subunit RPB2
MECIHKFLETPGFLVNHHINSYNEFIEHIPVIIKNQNPLTILKKKDDSGEFHHKCKIWIGGKDSSKITIGKPVFYENGIQKPLYPNDARLRNLTYAFSLHVELLFEITIEDGAPIEYTTPNILFGYFPIMIQSNLCILNGMPPEVRFNMGECKRDPGGYFIVDGSEKVIICQEGRANNSICTTKNYDEGYYYCADIKSESEDDSKFPRVTAVRIVTSKDDSSKVTKEGYTLNQIVVDMPDVRQPMPLFIVMRALGIISDKQIIETCLLGENMLQEYFHDSVCDAGNIYTQDHALQFIGSFTKYQSVHYTLRILSELFLPHVGELNFIDKAYFLGYMVKKVLRMAVGIDPITDRDSFRMKRMNSTGTLLSNLFNDFYNQQLKHVNLEIDRAYNNNETLFDKPEVFPSLFTSNYTSFFEERVTENGFKHGFKGSWGATSYTKIVGVSQKLNRLSFNSSISHLRKCVLQMDKSAKVVAPRLLHSSQWGLFDPVDTPDGGDVGTHKHMSICTRITEGFPKSVIYDELSRLRITVHPLEMQVTQNIRIMVKLFLNGHWIGCIEDPESTVKSLKFSRRHGVLPSSTSISWNIGENILYIYTDAGRLQRPIFYVDDDRVLSYNPSKLSWTEMTTGTLKRPCMIEYIDADEANTSLITFNHDEKFKKTLHTHVEIHGALILGFMGNQIIFPEHNQLPRNSFSCGQSKQAVSVYHTNHQNRMDTMGVVLNYGQMPLIQSSFIQSFGTLPYGSNAIVAIMCYSGYNTEDAILFNKSSLQRGLFNTSYFKTYEVSETRDEVGESNNMANPLVFEGGATTDERGLVHVNTPVTSETVLMRMTQGGKVKYVYPKKDQEGYVDRTFITENTPGRRMAKVRICHERIPNIGDKFASRAGQKGTCGLILNEEDMPFTEYGIRPDLIINPHALPSRMTIGQLIESLIGKVHLENGGMGDCTAFNTGNTDSFRSQLTQLGFHSSGTELLQNGMSGEILESDIFIGPTYYLRLKHMVADKINFRERGPNTSLTRQPVQGRSNEGGLRIGEMERDGVIANGMSYFVQESMMERGDGTMVINNSRKPYTINVDNSTGLLAIYNESTNLRISPTIDGIKFENETLTTIPKYEKTFSKLRVPYSFKLLLHELATMNVQARLITSDTVDQFENMRSKEIKNLCMPAFSSLMHDMYSIRTNYLYVSTTDDCYDPRKMFGYGKDLNPTIFPWLITEQHFEKLRYSSRSISPSPYESVYHKERCSLDIYKTNENSFDTTLNYYVNKMKTGIFVRIKHNKVFNFLPLYNINFKNDFHHLISAEDFAEFLKTVPKKKRGQQSTDLSTWHATNCLLRGEKRETDKDPTDAYLAQMYDMLVETCSNRKVNDCIFFMTRKDFPHLRKDWKEAFDAIYGDANLNADYFNKPFIPVVAQSTTEDHADFPFPTGDDWACICPTKKFASYHINRKIKNTKEIYCTNGSTPRNALPPWETRQSKVIWRGQGTGCGVTPETNPRMHLHSLQIPELDAGITRFTERIRGHNNGKLNLEYVVPTDEKVESIEMIYQTKYKFTINVEGNSAAYRFGGLLGLGFCILNVKSKYTLWFEPMIKMGKITDANIAECHCILIEHDLSDLHDAIKWCLENDDTCKKISENAMEFYNTHFTEDFVYDYVADMCNSISSLLHQQKDMYSIDNGKTLKSLLKMQPLTVEKYKQKTPLPTDTTAIIVPFRDSGDQNRSEHLEKFLEHYKDMNIFIVEQSNDGQKFNRGALLNIGYDYLTRFLPKITNFIVHDVDILMPADIVNRYYGEDEKELVHFGLLVKNSKYEESTNFLGRVLRLSKEMYKKINGFPNTFYGWGGEDDALCHRIGKNIVYRPDEKKVGIEQDTTNDIIKDKSNTRKEVHKVEQIISDTLQWKIDGVNSLQYSVIENKSIHDKVRKIIVQLSPSHTTPRPPSPDLPPRRPPSPPGSPPLRPPSPPGLPPRPPSPPGRPPSPPGRPPRPQRPPSPPGSPPRNMGGSEVDAELLNMDQSKLEILGIQDDDTLNNSTELKQISYT